LFAPTESELHQAVAEFLDVALLPPAVYSTFPAGWGKLSTATAGRLKAAGLKPGLPDLFVFDRHNMIANRTYPKVIGLELKAHGRKPSPAQQLMFPRLRALGIEIYVCECLEDVVEALERERVPLRIGLAELERSVRWRDDEQPGRKKLPPAETSAKLADAGDVDG
jgi:hypothetical protein